MELKDRFILFNGINQPFEESGIPLRVVSLPGHSDDSIGLLDGDSLFCGDALMNGFPGVNNVSIWIEDLDAYRRTWDLILSMNVGTIYPSHGKRTSPERLRKNRKKLDALWIRKMKTPAHG